MKYNFKEKIISISKDLFDILKKSHQILCKKKLKMLDLQTFRIYYISFWTKIKNTMKIKQKKYLKNKKNLITIRKHLCMVVL